MMAQTPRKRSRLCREQTCFELFVTFLSRSLKNILVIPLTVWLACFFGVSLEIPLELLTVFPFDILSEISLRDVPGIISDFLQELFL